MKTPKKEKFVKRDRTQPPVEAPYVPPKPQRTTKSLPDKTIEIFEGMTIVELAKRTGESITSLQSILVNVGEKVDSEFDPLSIDVAELVAMVLSLLPLEYNIDCSYYVKNNMIRMSILWDGIC